MKQALESLAHNLKNIRENRNLSLDKLADITGVSKSMLRQIEIDQSNPTIATIWKIANGLKVPFTALLREETQTATIKPFLMGSPLEGDTEGARVFPLISFSPERSFEVLYTEFEPGAAIDAEPHQGNAEEHVFMLTGTLEITVDERTFQVDRQNFISFQASTPHRYRNNGKEMATALTLISYLP